MPSTNLLKSLDCKQGLQELIHQGGFKQSPRFDRSLKTRPFSLKALVATWVKVEFSLLQAIMYLNLNVLLVSMTLVEDVEDPP